MTSTRIISFLIVTSAFFIPSRGAFAQEGPDETRPSVPRAEGPGKPDSNESPRDRRSLEQKAIGAGLDASVVKKLNRDQLFRLLQEKIRQKTVSGPNSFLVPTTFFVCTLLAILMALVYKSRRNQDLQVTLRAMVEKGAPIPTELIVRPARSSSDVKKGVLVLAVGAGLLACLLFIGIWERNAIKASGIAFVPLLVGLGYLLVAKLESRYKKEDESR